MVSWAIYLGFMKENGKTVKWELKEQMMPISMRCLLDFMLPSYVLAVSKAKRETGHFEICWKEADLIIQKHMFYSE